MIMRKIKGFSLGALVIVCSMLLVGCGSSTSKTKSSSSTSSSIVSKSSSSVKPDPNASDRTWTYKNNVFDAGNETYRFTKWSVMDSVNEGKKTLVLYCDVTNNSTKEMDPSNVYMVVHAYQKNSTSDIKLDPGMVANDENGNDPLQQYEDGLNNKLLPGKTVKAVITFTINNANPVRVEFENSDFETIGTKTYKVSKKISKAERKQFGKSNSSSATTKTSSVSRTSTVSQSSTANNATQTTTTTASANDSKETYSANPTQGGTIYQTDNDSGSFAGDPDVIADTQRIQESLARANGWE